MSFSYQSMFDQLEACRGLTNQSLDMIHQQSMSFDGCLGSRKTFTELVDLLG